MSAPARQHNEDITHAQPKFPNVRKHIISDIVIHMRGLECTAVHCETGMSRLRTGHAVRASPRARRGPREDWSFGRKRGLATMEMMDSAE